MFVLYIIYKVKIYARMNTQHPDTHVCSLKMKHAHTPYSDIDTSTYRYTHAHKHHDELTHMLSLGYFFFLTVSGFSSSGDLTIP